MKRFTQIFFFVFLLVTLVVTACSLRWDIASEQAESLNIDGAKPNGLVTGKICYPSESIPPMTVYFRSTLDSSVKTLEIEADQNTYSVNLEPGTYVAYAYPKDETTHGGMYSAMVSCGLADHCKDHTLLPVEVRTGETVSDIDICDWYAEAGMVPLPPDADESNTTFISKLTNQDTSAQDSGLSAGLEIPKHLLIGEEVNLKFTLINPTDTPIYILEWYTPLEGIAGEIFQVSLEGQEIPYEGMLVFRGDPTPDSYILLNPGEATSAVVDLATSFNFSKAGVYKIEFISPRISHIAFTEDEMATSVDDLGSIQILSSPVTLEIGDK
jgi:hypothetical protein